MSIEMIKDLLVCPNCNKKFEKQNQIDSTKYYCNLNNECNMYLLFFNINTIAIYSKTIGIYLYHNKIYKIYCLSFPSNQTKRLASFIDVQEFDISEKKLNDFIFLSQEVINKFYKLNNNLIFI